jgi:hypothetical protein
MATTAPEMRRSTYGVGAGSAAEILGGIGAIVLSIVGLTNLASTMMMSIVTILLGMTLLFEGAGVAASYSRLVGKTRLTSLEAEGEASGGMTTEMLAGIAGIVLGILALLGNYPAILVPSAIIVFGAAMIFNTGAISELSEMQVEAARGGEETVETSRRIARAAMAPVIGSENMIGLAAVVLGILAVVGVVPVTLSLVALLSLGSAELLIGSTLGGRLLSLLTR